MEKYIGLVKIVREYMGGASIVFKSRTYDDPTLLEKWFEFYPGCEHVLLNNTPELDSMFSIVKDYNLPLTEEEERLMLDAQRFLNEIMTDDDQKGGARRI